MYSYVYLYLLYIYKEVHCFNEMVLHCSAYCVWFKSLDLELPCDLRFFRWDPRAFKVFQAQVWFFDIQTIDSYKFVVKTLPFTCEWKFVSTEFSLFGCILDMQVQVHLVYRDWNGSGLFLHNGRIEFVPVVRCRLVNCWRPCVVASASTSATCKDPPLARAQIMRCPG